MKSKLRERRKALNLRMIDTALKSGVGVSTIWLIENGYSQRVSLQTKRKIATALGVNIEELF
jgi:transcriptional regulator with XRE-family HTH domain